MDAPETNCSYSDTDESVELHALGGILRFGSNTDLRNYIESISANAPKGRADVTAERLNDILIAGATARADINYVINELQAARDYLQAEAERVRLANADMPTWRRRPRPQPRLSSRVSANGVA
jgi:hypothetical protein